MPSWDVAGTGMIDAVGIDLIDVARIEAIRNKWKMKFLKRVYSEGEIEYCESKAVPAQHYAARFAVKEAFLKCLGTGMAGGVCLKEIEVVHDVRGKPALKIHGKSGDSIRSKHITSTHVSISHTERSATAIVMTERA